MNRIIRLFASVFVIASLLVYSQCGSSGSDEPSLEESLEANLSGTFNLTSATPPRATFTEFLNPPNTITFGSSGAFSSQNTIPESFEFALFPETANWSVQSASTETSGTVLIDNATVTVGISDDILTLSFTLDAGGDLINNRESNVDGQWTVMATQ